MALSGKVDNIARTSLYRDIYKYSLRMFYSIFLMFCLYFGSDFYLGMGRVSFE